MLRNALGWSAERLSEAEKIAVEVQPGFDIAGVKVHQSCDKHVQQI